MKRANTFPNGSPITTKLTYEDYLKTSDDERYELLDGELIILPAPSIMVSPDLWTTQREK